ncbi:CsgG/HfaB family protein [Campylobacter sp. RM12327]|uniref:CsgG/HfaB family protein n=1 Tax=Campylobacter sputorum TaxID=206 RepID=UPI000B76DDBD|nr:MULTISPECIES: CsgG/HfaB family protein [Campylobacter]ASM39349.1 putative lipoprotein, CsgG family [Campylobacter sputorum]MBE7358799.1 CsgG/HfaB family protein [Campylobacter sp. RM11302]MBF6670099.1 CsgG/HfaB family protein [Campylobacter sp. RM12327]MBF6675216.1 CsgG/HfaB family protein [Campylobacter sp. RM13538]MBF6676827.1 CsgG/HfaB family protein [Campylobacter sp. RM12321]
MKQKILILVCTAVVFVGCASESSRVVEVPKVEISKVAYQGQKISVSIGRFNNQSSYQNGIFSDGEDRLGNQAQTILATSLQQSGRFDVLDRTNLKAMAQESGFSKTTQDIKGARYIITGDVVEFGRKTVGDHQLFGILGRGKTQIAYSKVNLNIVDVKTSQIVYSTQGAGEYSLSNREVIGFGGTAGYDATLNGRVLSLSINEAVNNLALGLDNKEWK